MQTLLVGQVGVLLGVGGPLQVFQSYAERVESVAVCRHGGEGARGDAGGRGGDGTESAYPSAYPEPLCGHVKYPRSGGRAPVVGVRVDMTGTGERWAALAVSQSAERL
ncbi:hypothetical protein Saso_65440 [Streptomyces asoensis]|uniref:Uncharacterized protein n=1 Tax=Streptomyces asoensis TaxID=249586 RepID=A0ABQ3S9T9_9ACTN|nr:hypothetical protein GCM10010496_70060 [Streptomyces asoensis]GHI64894.1 hypothetical protein Saso_65440 [Streptomyces asoensis]